jgi:hypothetical protein
MLFRDFAQLHEVLLGPPFCSSGAFLIKLAKVIQVVDVETNALGVGRFAARRKPDVVDANLLEFGQLRGKALVVFVVIWTVPLVALEQSAVLRCWLLIYAIVSFLC